MKYLVMFSRSRRRSDEDGRQPLYFQKVMSFLFIFFSQRGGVVEADIYDPCFLLPLFVSLLQPGLLLLLSFLLVCAMLYLLSC